MMVHPFHYRLLKYMIRKKMKGDHRALLSCADRLDYLKEHGLKLSETLIKRILCEDGLPPPSLLQHTLNELVRGVGYRDWNAFIRANPVPEGLPPNIKKKKLEMQLEESVQKCLKKWCSAQLALEFE